MIAEALLTLAIAGNTPAIQPMPALTRYESHSTERGWRPSLYRGKWFRKSVEPIRKCIGTRESHFQYMLSNGGAYQFMSGWKPSAGAWMLKREIRAKHGRKAADHAWHVLASHPFNQWSRWAQDALFYTVWRDGKGKHHWDPTVAGTGCF